MSWTRQYAGGDQQAFLVDDETGVAYVDPDGAEVMLTSGDETIVEGGEPPPAEIREFLDRETDLGEAEETVGPIDPGTRDRRYKEVRIDVGEPVLVAGHADRDGSDRFDEPVSTTITKRGDAPRFYVTDDPDSSLTRRLLSEAVVSFLAAGILLAIAYWLVVT